MQPKGILMKRSFSGIAMAMALLVSAPCFAQQAPVTLTLEKAKHYQSKKSGKTYIQADRFKRESNANYYKRFVQSKTKYPVHVIRSHGFYYVTIGPISSAAEVRKTADKYSVKPGVVEKPKHVKQAKHKKKWIPASAGTTSKAKPAAKLSKKEQAKLSHAELARRKEANRKALIAQWEEEQRQMEKTAKAKKAKHANNATQAHPVEPSKQAVETTPVDPPKQADLTQPVSPADQGKQPYFLQNVSGTWIASAGAGWQYPNYKSNMYVNNGSGAPPPYDVDLYTTKERSQGIAALALGRRWTRDKKWIPSFSLLLSYQHIFSKSVGSNILQYSGSEFTNYNYDWEIASDVVLALLKLNLVNYKKVSPYLLGGMGAAFNRTSNYSESALAGVTPRDTPGFPSNISTSFAYRLGAGLDFRLDEQFILSAEYQYQFIGSMYSKYGTGLWSNQQLNLGPYRANGVLVNLTYLFNE